MCFLLPPAILFGKRNPIRSPRAPLPGHRMPPSTPLSCCRFTLACFLSLQHEPTLERAFLSSPLPSESIFQNIPESCKSFKQTRFFSLALACKLMTLSLLNFNKGSLGGKNRYRNVKFNSQGSSPVVFVLPPTGEKSSSKKTLIACQSIFSQNTCFNLS